MSFDATITYKEWIKVLMKRFGDKGHYIGNNLKLHNSRQLSTQTATEYLKSLNNILSVVTMGKKENQRTFLTSYVLLCMIQISRIQ